MKRRELILGGGVALLGTIANPAAGQQPGRVYRVGVLLPGEESPGYRKLNQFLIDELGRQGFVQGRNLEMRFSFGPDETLAERARDLIAFRPDALIASGTPLVRALQSLTKTIPIVFVANDPLADGLVPNMLRPGGNTTGVSRLTCELTPKLLQLLRELAPNARRVVAVTSPHNPCSAGLEALRPQLAAIVVTKAEEALTMKAILREKPDAVLANNLPPGATNALALKHRIPIAGTSGGPGVIVSLQRDVSQVVQRHAGLVAKVLQGANPGELPVEFPREFHLVVDKKTAREIGVRIPESILLRADRIIE